MEWLKIHAKKEKSTIQTKLFAKKVYNIRKNRSQNRDNDIIFAA